MPFKSIAQRKFMYAKHPKMAAEFSKMTPKGAKLPEKATVADQVEVMRKKMPVSSAVDSVKPVMKKVIKPMMRASISAK